VRTTILALLVTGLAATGFAALNTPASPPPNLDRAIAAQQARAAQSPDDPQVRNDLGNLLMLDGRSDDAEAAYRAALDLAPDMASAHYNLGLLLAQKGESKAALGQFQAVLAKEPDHAWAHYQLGALYDARGAENKAIQEYAKAFRLDPQLAFPEVNPAIIDNGHVTEALLIAYRNLPAAAEAPKTYEDASRIVSLMVPPTKGSQGAEGAETMAEGAASADETGQAAGSAEAAGQGQGMAPRPSLPAAEQDETEQDGEPGGRVLRPEDLEKDRGLNQAAPSGATSGTYYPPQGGVRTQPRTYYQPPSNLPQGRSSGNTRTIQPAQPSTRPNGTRRFVPGIPSTGRLDMELLPGQAEPADATTTPAG